MLDSLTHIRDALGEIEKWQLGGHWGGRAFFTIAWLGVLWVFASVPFYAWAAIMASRGHLHSTLIADILLRCIILIGVLLLVYIAYLWWYRTRKPIWNCPNGGTGLGCLLQNQAESAAFLRIFAQACPFAELKVPNTIARFFLTIGIYFARYILGHYGSQPDKWVIVVDGVSALALLFLGVRIAIPLWKETRQWTNPQKYPLCRYTPLLRLARYARNVRDS